MMLRSSRLSKGERTIPERSRYKSSTAGPAARASASRSHLASSSVQGKSLGYPHESVLVVDRGAVKKDLPFPQRSNSAKFD